MGLRVTVALLYALAGSVQADSLPLPNGWRIPTEAELTAAGNDWREGDLLKFQIIHADFDGDGATDEAVLLASTTKPKYGLFVLRSDAAPVQLEAQDLTQLQSIGIELLRPGDYKTACGKGYWACSPAEPKVLGTQLPGIRYFKYESAESAYVWSQSNGSFVHIWLSD